MSPLHAVAPVENRDGLTVLRLTDGAAELAYAVVEPIEIVTLPAALAPAAAPGVVAGVVMLGGEQVEVIDPYQLFAGLAGPAAGARPLCLMEADAGGWMETFLKPAIEASGYRCVSRLDAGETAAVALTMDETAPAAGGTPVVRLRSRPAAGGAGDDSVYRYDRVALIAALDARSGGGRR